MDPIRVLFDTLPNIYESSTDPIELECRFSIDKRKKNGIMFRDEAISLAKKIIADHIEKGTRCEINQSINFITSKGNIKQLNFINGVQQKDSAQHYTKQHIINTIHVLDEPQYKISCATEKPIPEFKLENIDTTRIKLRFSIFMEEWRLDITLVKELNGNNLSELKTMKNTMLTDLSFMDYDRAPWIYASMIEFELEYIGSSPTADSFKNAVRNFMDYLHTQDYQGLIYKIATAIERRDSSRFRSQNGLKQLSNQVIELNKNTFLKDILPTITDFYITDKVDGDRTLLYISNQSYAINDKLIPLDYKEDLVYIFDGEFYNAGAQIKDHVDRIKSNETQIKGHVDRIYYIFDVLVWEGKNISNEPFSTRMTYFEQAAKQFPIIRTKPFVRFTNDFQNQIREFKEQKKPYETDGFVFTPSNHSYSDMKVYKYKPVSHLTIDFLIKKCPDKLLNINPYKKSTQTLYLLYCGISNMVFKKLKMELIKHYTDVFPDVDTYRLPQYFPCPFQPSNRKFAYLYYSDDPNLDGNVGEFRVPNYQDDISEYEWELVRIRHDRKTEVDRGNYFGNNYKVAEFVWMAYRDPLIIESMELNVYFQQHESVAHLASRSYNSYVKGKILEPFRNTEYVMDMASGKGQDFFRYSQLGMKNVTFLEIDKTALMELINRKHEFANSRKFHNSMSVSVNEIDLNKRYKDNIDNISSLIFTPLNGYNLIFCSLAFHYLISDKASIINIGRFIKHYLKPGGRFIFTAFDGRAVFNLLSETGEWKSPGKFHIVKKYETNMFAPYGQKIDVLLPFSNDQYYTEYLVNIEYIALEFENLGLTMETKKSFGDYINGYNGKGDKALDADDKLYTSLYHYYGFYKESKS